MFGGLNLRVRTEAFEKSSYLPMRSSDSFKKKRAQLRPFKEERRKTISSFYDGERRRRPGAIKNEQKRRPGVMSCDETSFTSINRSGDDMDSMANDYSFSVGNDECGQSPPISENEYPWREHVLTCNLRYLHKILNKTSRSVALNTTGERENDPANQTVEKKGVQEDTGDKGKAEAAVTQRIHETNTQGEPNPSNETTVEAERQPMATLIQESPRPVCSHFLRQCFVRFPCCGMFFPCHLCHNESDCIEDQAKAIDATHIRCTICYNEQVVRFYMRTEYKFSSLAFSETRHTATSQSSYRCCQMVMLIEILEIDCWSDFLSLICMTFSMHFRSMKIARGAAPATRKCLNISVQHVNTLLLIRRTLSIARSVGSAG